MEIPKGPKEVVPIPMSYYLKHHTRLCILGNLCNPSTKDIDSSLPKGLIERSCVIGCSVHHLFRGWGVLHFRNGAIIVRSLRRTQGGVAPCYLTEDKGDVSTLFLILRLKHTAIKIITVQLIIYSIFARCDDTTVDPPEEACSVKGVKSIFS